MSLILSLPVWVVVLSLVLEGPALAQAAPQISSTLELILDKLKEFGKALHLILSIKQSDIPSKTQNWFSKTFNKGKERLKITFS
ncbi:apolipoprotein C-I-like [Leopardus geoffroyi]|uniref:apolipoprotein C-I-like n=1 Tax=Leopardus geoffroyi TaxID=46844 RepID=UPI001E25D7B9|nr:apolipoprotein C-I-like [Leopardus geoffroyi]